MDRRELLTGAAAVGAYAFSMDAADATVTKKALVTGVLGGGRRPYLGSVATRTRVPNSSGSANTKLMSRSYHIARDNISAARIILTNTAGTDTVANSSASVTYTASIEYPAGTFNQVTFSASTSVLVTAGAKILSDLINLSVVIPKGAIFWVRVFFVSSGAGLLYCSQANTSLDAMTFGTGGAVTDQTMGGTVAQTHSSLCHYPAAILGYTRLASFGLIGDSRVSGQGETSSTTLGDMGEIARSVGPNFAYINLGTAGASFASIISAHANLADYGQYCTHLISNLTINSTASSAAGMLANHLTIRSYFSSNSPFWACTIAPKTSSTDSWATLVNQTDTSGNRAAYNSLILPGVAGFAGVFDLASVVENSSKWIVNGAANYATADGLHESTTAYGLIQSSGIIAIGGVH